MCKASVFIIPPGRQLRSNTTFSFTVQAARPVTHCSYISHLRSARSTSRAAAACAAERVRGMQGEGGAAPGDEQYFMYAQVLLNWGNFLYERSQLASRSGQVRWVPHPPARTLARCTHAVEQLLAMAAAMIRMPSCEQGCCLAPLSPCCLATTT